MTHRLQVLFEKDEIAAVRAAARRRRMTVSEYVRQTLREARIDQPDRASTQKLMMIREAAALTYPTGDPHEMEAAIARGYLDEVD